MASYQSRNPLRRADPMRQISLYRTVESVFGPSPVVRAEYEMKTAAAALAADLNALGRERQALGDANHRPVATRHYWQGQALRTLNRRRASVRSARKRVAAAQAALDALKSADAQPMSLAA